MAGGKKLRIGGLWGETAPSNVRGGSVQGGHGKETAKTFRNKDHGIRARGGRGGKQGSLTEPVFGVPGQTTCSFHAPRTVGKVATFWPLKNSTRSRGSQGGGGFQKGRSLSCRTTRKSPPRLVHTTKKAKRKGRRRRRATRSCSNKEGGKRNVTKQKVTS